MLKKMKAAAEVVRLFYVFHDLLQPDDGLGIGPDVCAVVEYSPDSDVMTVGHTHDDLEEAIEYIRQETFYNVKGYVPTDNMSAGEYLSRTGYIVLGSTGILATATMSVSDDGEGVTLRIVTPGQDDSSETTYLPSMR